MTLFTLVTTEDFYVELSKNLDELLVSMEFKIEAGAEIEFSEFNTAEFFPYSRTALRKKLKTAIDVYEDNLLIFVIRRHEL